MNSLLVLLVVALLQRAALAAGVVRSRAEATSKPLQDAALTYEDATTRSNIGHHDYYARDDTVMMWCRDGERTGGLTVTKIAPL